MHGVGQGIQNKNNSNNSIVRRLIINNSYLAKGEQGGLLVDSWTPEQEVVGSKSTSAILCS